MSSYLVSKWRHFFFNFSLGLSMETTLATITDLPTELLLVIFGHLNAKELYHLSLVSRRLHHIALPLHLSCCGIHNPQVLTFSSRSKSMRGLPGLRIAQFVTSIQCLKYSFGFLDDPTILLHELREITRLIQIPSLTQVEKVFLDFQHVNFWKRSQGRAQMRTTIFELNQWTETLGGLVNALASKSCKILTVHGGGLYSAQYQDFDILALSSPPESGIAATLSSSTLITAMQNMFHPNTKGALLSNESTIARHVGFRKRRLPHERQSADERQLLVLNSLATFHLESSIILHQPFLDWTITTLNISSIECLTISLADLRTGTWPVFLSFLTLSSLRILSIHRSHGLHLTDFVSFLSRHSTLQSLDLIDGTLTPNAPNSQTIISSKSHPRSAKSTLYLPKLTSLHATPDYIARILTIGHRSSSIARDAFPKLNDICSLLPSEAPSIPALDSAIMSLSRVYHVPNKNLHLTLQFSCDHLFIQWIKRKTRYPESLRVVTSLKLDSGFPLNKEGAIHLPGWLAMFPGLLHVMLMIDNETLNAEERATFISELKQSCPELVSINMLSMEAWLAGGDEQYASLVGRIRGNFVP